MKLGANKFMQMSAESKQRVERRVGGAAMRSAVNNLRLLKIT